MTAREKADEILASFKMLEEKMAHANPSSQDFPPLMREYAQLRPQAEAAGALAKAVEEMDSLLALQSESEKDPDLAHLAEEEQKILEKRLQELEERFASLLSKDEDSALHSGGLILELRAGTGGEEACLFAGDLLRMYQRYASAKGWKFDLMNMSESETGGIREAVIALEGAGAYARLQFESGVHRVQRVPATESSGRIHTSAATVAVLPEPQDYEVQLEDKDLRIDVFRASGPGGQSVNTTDSAVRITHLPSGLVVIQQDEKSQHKNRAKAMKVLRARLYEKMQEEERAARAETRRGQVGSGDRSERIRTYNFPQNRVSDHRISLSLHKLGLILDGALDLLIDPLEEAKK